MMEDLVLLKNRGNWSQVILNRPERLNSLNEDMLQQLKTVLEGLAEDNSCRAVLLSGAGRAFCAGQDLADCVPNPGTQSLDLADIMRRLYNPLVMLLRGMPKPVVCAVNGVAAGGGANIALACDLVIAGNSANFIQAFAKIGLVPDCGGTFFLPRLIGDARARGLALLAQPISGSDAELWGMIWRAVPDADLAFETEKITAYLATQPTQSFALLKKALALSSTNDLQTQLDLECDLQKQASSTSDFTEGLSAFFEKRAASFTGNKP